uniref:Serpentine Receptor, class T n=1 Tax=Steinernema glaseri TaxID=37863 RepID=A0A1I7YF32_9BILA
MCYLLENALKSVCSSCSFNFMFLPFLVRCFEQARTFNLFTVCGAWFTSSFSITLLHDAFTRSNGFIELCAYQATLAVSKPMDGDRATHIAVGCLSIIIPALFLPCYIRILMIFICSKRYRSLECYQIMVQMGVAQCLMSPSWILFGIAHLTQVDYGGLTALAYVLATSAIRAEAVLSLLLALNRLCIICRFKMPTMLFRLFNLLAWLIALAQSAILLSPIAGFTINPLIFRPGYDTQKPTSSIVGKVGNYFLMASFSLTFIIYVAVVGVLIYQKAEAHIKSTMRKERGILVYAGIRFLADYTCVFTYQVGPQFFPASYWTDIGVYFTYPANNLIIPIILYLSLYK